MPNYRLFYNKLSAGIKFWPASIALKMHLILLTLSAHRYNCVSDVES